MDYEVGQHVYFLDENQCEIVGTIVRRIDTVADRLILVIKLDAGGYYEAWLRRY